MDIFLRVKKWKHPLISIILSLNSNDWSLLQQQLKMNATKSNTQILTLFSHLRRTCQKSETPIFDALKIYTAVFKNESFNNDKLSRLAYKLKQIIVDFFIAQELNAPENKFKKNAFYANALRKRGLFQAYKKELKNLNERLEKETCRDDSILLLAAENKEQLYFHTIEDTNHLLGEPLAEIAQGYLLFFTLKNLKIGAELSKRKLQKKTVIELPILTQNLTFINLEEQPILIRLYSKVIEMNQAFVEEDYNLSLAICQETQHIFQNNFHQIPANEQADIASFIRTLLINFYTTEKDTSVVGQLFKFNNFVLESRVYTRNNKMTYTTFINFYSIALINKKYLYAASFLNTHLEYLETSLQKPVRLFCKARLDFATENFDKVEVYLKELEFSSWTLYAAMNSLILRSLFESKKNNTAGIEARSKKLIKKINSSRKKNKHKEPLKNFLKILRKLNAFKTRTATIQIFVEEELEELKNYQQYVEKEKYITNKPWLLNVIKDLLSKGT